MATGTKQRRKFDVTFKEDVLRYAAEHSGEKAAKHFNIDPKQIRYWKKQRNELKAADGKSARITGGGRKKVSEVMETLLSEWMYALRDKHNRVSRTMIQRKAMEIYPTVSDGGKAFVASKGWLEKFLHRNALRLCSLAHHAKQEIELDKPDPATSEEEDMDNTKPSTNQEEQMDTKPVVDPPAPQSVEASSDAPGAAAETLPDQAVDPADGEEEEEKQTQTESLQAAGGPETAEGGDQAPQPKPEDEVVTAANPPTTDTTVNEEGAPVEASFMDEDSLYDYAVDDIDYWLESDHSTDMEEPPATKSPKKTKKGKKSQAEEIKVEEEAPVTLEVKKTKKRSERDEQEEEEALVTPKEEEEEKPITPETNDESGDHRDSPDEGSSNEAPQQAWRTEAEPDTANPHPPRFRPKRHPGPQPPLTHGTPTPYDIFSLFFDAEVLRLLCTNTNKNAKKNKEMGKTFAWKDITPRVLKIWLGLLLYQSVCRLPKISDLWRVKSIFHVPFPPTMMSRDRFRNITSNLHMSDPEKDAANDKTKGAVGYDPLHKVRALLEIIRNRCQSVYHPNQHISVDERMVATKARVVMKQYMKAKPTKWGLKFFVLADVNGYTVDFQMYTGRNEGASGKGLSFDVVANLVNKDYLGSGYIVYVDNFYTSPLLFRHLSQQGFGACGTYRQHIVGVPKTLVNALDKKSKRGSIRWIRDNNLLFVKWMDTREVSMCTTVHSVYSGETVLRWEKGGDGPKRKVPFPRPTAVGEYNRYMGGVDTSDQMLGTNSVHRQTKRWPITIFQHMLDISATNSFIVHKELTKLTVPRRNPLTRQRFQEELCAALLGVPLAGPPKPPPPPGHYPVPTNKAEDTTTTYKRATTGRKGCAICKRSTPWMCVECGDVALCIQVTRNCFREYHTE